MIIKNLEIQNINSLSGVHKIDFARGLKGENLFAITGNTGAGKSTILLSIGLALYGKHYKNDINQADFITLGQQTGSVSLTIKLGDKTYNCYWECTVRKKSGELLARPRSKKIISLEGKVIDKTAQEIIGMDYTQFTKCVILNQGEFSRFLSSKYSERKSILEKLYHGQSFSSISKVLKESIRDKSSEIKLLKAESEGIIPFNEEEIKEISEEFTQIDSNIKELEEHFNDSNVVMELLEKLTSLGINSIKAEESVKKHTDEINKLKKLVDKNRKSELTLSEKLKNKRVEIAKIEQEFKLKLELLSSIERKNKRIERDRTEIKSLETSIENKKSKTKELKLKEKENNKQLEKLNEIDREVEKRSLHLSRRDGLSALLEMQLTIKSVKKEIKGIQVEVSKKVEGLEKEKEAREKLEAEAKRLNGELDSHPQIEISQNDIELAKIVSDEISSLKEQRTNDVEMITQNRIMVNETKSRKAAQITKIERLKEEMAVHEKHKLINELVESAQHKKECPVCRQSTSEMNLEAPILSALPDIQSEENELKAIDEQLMRISSLSHVTEDKLKELDKRIEKRTAHLNEKLSSFEASSVNELDRLLKKKLERDTLRERTEHKITKNTFALESRSNQISEKENELLAIRTQEKQGLKKLEELWPKFQEGCAKLEIDVEENLSKLQNETNTILDTLQKYSDAGKSKVRLEDDIKRISKEIVDEIQKCDDTRERIEFETVEIKEVKSKIKKLSIPDNMDEKAFSLLEKQLQKLENETNSERKKTKESEYNLAKEERSLSILKDNILSQKREITMAQAQIGQYREKFSDETITHALAKIIKADNYDKFIQGHEFIVHFKDNKFSRRNKEISDEYRNKLLRRAELKSKHELIEKKLNRKNELDSQIQSLEKCLGPRLELLSLFGRDEFRGFALNMIEQSLINYANSELEELLDGRYRLAKIDDKDDEYYVIDHHFEGTIRKSSTLSGGETFIVSLALALGLAEMLKGGTEINSFFIDEGFGNLDNQSLDQVLDLLNDANNDQRKIGVISHITKLTERIPINLRVSKEEDNSRSIEFCYN